jgi:hypothetical protein
MLAARRLPPAQRRAVAEEIHRRRAGGLTCAELADWFCPPDGDEPPLPRADDERAVCAEARSGSTASLYHPPSEAGLGRVSGMLVFGGLGAREPPAFESDPMNPLYGEALQSCGPWREGETLNGQLENAYSIYGDPFRKRPRADWDSIRRSFEARRRQHLAQREELLLLERRRRRRGAEEAAAEADPVPQEAAEDEDADDPVPEDDGDAPAGQALCTTLAAFVAAPLAAAPDFSPDDLATMNAAWVARQLAADEAEAKARRPPRAHATSVQGALAAARVREANSGSNSSHDLCLLRRQPLLAVESIAWLTQRMPPVFVPPPQDNDRALGRSPQRRAAQPPVAARGTGDARGRGPSRRCDPAAGRQAGSRAAASETRMERSGDS